MCGKAGQIDKRRVEKHQSAIRIKDRKAYRQLCERLGQSLYKCLLRVLRKHHSTCVNCKVDRLSSTLYTCNIIPNRFVVSGDAYAMHIDHWGRSGGRGGVFENRFGRPRPNVVWTCGIDLFGHFNVGAIGPRHHTFRVVLPNELR